MLYVYSELCMCACASVYLWCVCVCARHSVCITVSVCPYKCVVSVSPC